MLKAIVKILAKMPIAVHYWIADYILYPLIYHVFRYRRSVVAHNLTSSFPEKSNEEIQQISRGFYHHICNVVVEAIYGYGLTDAQMREHITFDNTEAYERLAIQHGGGIIILAHYGNWEWLLNISKQWRHPELKMGGVYKRLKNKAFDDLVLDMRRQQGAIMIEKQRILREIVQPKAKDVVMVYGLLSDQTPQPKNTHLWSEFLHQETPWLTGTDSLARKYDLPVAYVSISMLRRGYYHVSYSIISSDPTTESPNVITEKYISLLEEDIKRQPELWLWSHKRWKYKKSQPS